MPVNQVSFTDYGAEQADIERRRKMAEALQMQSQEMPQGQNVSGWYVGPSWTQGLATALKGVMAEKKLTDLDQRQRDLSQRTQADAMKWASSQPVASAEMTSEFPGEEPHATGKTTQPTQQQRLAWALQGVSNPLTSQIAQKVAGSTMMPSSWQQNIAHLDPGKYTPESIRAAMESGDPWQLRPAVTPSAQLGADVNREKLLQKQREWASLSPMQQAQLEQKAAQLGISAQELFFNSGIQVPVPAAPTNTGPGAGPPAPTPAQRPPQVPTPADFPRETPQSRATGTAAQLRIIDGEIGQLQQMLASAQNPQERAQFQADIEALNREKARIAPPATPTAAPKPTLPQGITPKKATELRAEAPAARGHLDMANTFADNLIASIDRATKAKLGRVTGIMGVIPSIPGMAGADAQAAVDAVKSQASIQTLQQMRQSSKTGGAVGAVTEQEWPRLEAAVVSLGQAQSEEQFRDALTKLRAVTENLKKIATQAYKGTYEGLLSATEPGDGAPPPAGGRRSTDAPASSGFRVVRD